MNELTSFYPLKFSILSSWAHVTTSTNSEQENCDSDKTVYPNLLPVHGEVVPIRNETLHSSLRFGESAEEKQKLRPLRLSENKSNLSSPNSDGDSEDEEEEQLVSLIKDVASNNVTFSEETYTSVFDRLRSAVLCLENDELKMDKKKRILMKAYQFCRLIVKSEKRNIPIMTKHVFLFLDFLLEMLMQCDTKDFSDNLLSWFIFFACHVPMSKSRPLNSATVILSEMISGERSDAGLENLLHVLPYFLKLSADHDNLQYYTQLVNRLLVPLYRLKCFYLSPKHKDRKHIADERPKLLRDRLHYVVSRCIMKFPEISDTFISSLLRFWDCYRHLRVNPIQEEMELIETKLQSSDLKQADQITDAKLKLISSFEKCARQKKRKRREQRKRIDSLKRLLRQSCSCNKV